MAMLHMDHIEGRPRGEQDEKGWVMQERVGRVTDLTGTGYQLHKNAMRVWGLPAIGDVHPSIADLYVTKRSPETIDMGVVDVRITYERRDEEDNSDYDEITYSTSLTQRESNRDDNGDLMKVWFGDKKQSGPVSVDMSVTQITYRHKSSVPPTLEKLNLVGSLNSGPWGRFTSAVAYEWKYASFQSNSSDGGKTYSEIYVFERAPFRNDSSGNKRRTWNIEVAYLDPETGRIPDAVISNPDAHKDSIKQYRMNPIGNFDLLGL